MIELEIDRSPPAVSLLEIPPPANVINRIGYESKIRRSVEIEFLFRLIFVES